MKLQEFQQDTNKGLYIGATTKAFYVGILLCLLLSVAEPQLVLVNSSSGFCSDFICAGAIVLLVLFTGIINVILGRINRNYALDSHELIVVYSMLLVASAIPTWGLTSNLIPIIAGFKY